MARKPEESSGDKAKPTGFPDFTSLFADVKIPSLGEMGPLLHAQSRNMEVLIAANRVAMEGTQAYARRYMEIVQGSFSELTAAMQLFAKIDGPQARMAKQLELMKQARERTAANMEGLGELIQKSNNEVIQLLTTRFAEAIDEMQGLMAKAGQQAP